MVLDRLRFVHLLTRRNVTAGTVPYRLHFPLGITSSTTGKAADRVVRIGTRTLLATSDVLRCFDVARR